jgi:hypothetical protein
MKYFRRGLLFGMLGLLSGTFIYSFAHYRSQNYDVSVSSFLGYLSLLGIYSWCAACLKTEPQLTRFALIISTLAFGIAGFSITISVLLDS